MSTSKLPAFLLLVMALVATTAGADASGLADGGVRGTVTSATEPLRAVSVYAYQLAGAASFDKAVTDAEGSFLFSALPAGLYKIIAFKPGFLPVVVMLSRMAADAEQVLELELDVQAAEADPDGGFWALREKIPSDVLRDIEYAVLEADFRTGVYSGLQPTDVTTEMRATTGVHEGLDTGSTTMAGAEVDVEGRFRDYLVGVSGNFSQLQPDASFGQESTVGRTQQVALELLHADASRVRVSSLNNSLRTFEGSRPDSVDFEHHMVSWSRPIGADAHSQFTAQYTEENNFYRQGPIESPGVPDSSRTLRVEGSYTTPVSEKATIQAGFRYRDLETDYDTPSNLTLLPRERVELFSRGGVQVKPALLVQYGLFSTLRDGTLSLVPQGGVVVRLPRDWQASALASHRIDQDEDYEVRDFTPSFFNETDECDPTAAYCYQLMLARPFGENQGISFGAMHRKYGETMRVYFDRDFYDRLESLFFVPGDSLPELKFELTRRLGPEILTRLESNVASGGGGVLVSDSQTRLENRVSYVVTSLDTQFERTSTGVFLAFHHLQQDLLPLQGQEVAPKPASAPATPFRFGFLAHPLAFGVAETGGKQVELQRLQLMLTQDLSILHALAADWAVHLNMELSRGITPDSTLFDADELRKRLTGGIAVRF